MLSTHHEVIFNSELNEKLVFIKTRNSAGTHLSEKPRKKTNIDKVHLK